MTIQFATSAAPLTFAAQMNAPMPRGLRQEADAMTFEAFHDEYATRSGPLRLGHWQCTDAERPSARLGPQARTYRPPWPSVTASAHRRPPRVDPSQH